MRSEREFDYSSLTRALNALAEGLADFAKMPERDISRDGCILRFSVVFELTHKMLRDFLKATSPSPDEIDSLPFPDLIRTGSERGVLLNGWPRWKAFRAARAVTSHTYDEDKAREVFAVIPDFLVEARYLHQRLIEALQP